MRRERYLQSDEDVSQGLTVRVMAVHRQSTDWHLSGHSFKHVNHATRSPHPYSIAQGDLIAAHGVQTLGDL